MYMSVKKMLNLKKEKQKEKKSRHKNPGNPWNCEKTKFTNDWDRGKRRNQVKSTENIFKKSLKKNSPV